MTRREGRAGRWVQCPECGREQDKGNRLTRDQIKRKLGLAHLPLPRRFEFVPQIYWCRCSGGTLFRDSGRKVTTPRNRARGRVRR
jgi:hypothetical protein